jgi:hypothetical protein
MSVAKNIGEPGERTMGSLLTAPTAIRREWQEASEDAAGSAEGSEKRKHRRVQATIPVRVRYGGLFEASAEISNLSAHGIFLHTDKKIASGSQIELVFQLPEKIFRRDGVWMCCQAEVVRVEEGRRGQHVGVAAAMKQYEVLVA